jgi:hypothetical protein
MHLDPDAPAGDVEDRRDEYGGRGYGGGFSNARWPDLSFDAGGADVGRGPEDGLPYKEASNRGGGELRCFDRVLQRDVPLSVCKRTHAPLLPKHPRDGGGR